MLRPFAVHVRRIVHGIEVGDGDGLGPLRVGEDQVKTIEQVEFVVRPYGVNGATRIGAQHGPGGIARGHDGIIAVARHAHIIEEVHERA